MDFCPCGSQKAYKDCCEKLHSANSEASTAEMLMRARYSAFVKNELDYVEKTHIPGTRDFDKAEAKKWAESSIWEGLEVLKTHLGKENDETGVVEFKAKYKDSKDNHFNHHEVSNFKKENGKWYYVNGSIVGIDPIKRAIPKIGRNEPCHCGSGKKFKKCCGA